ncbi:MAG: LacI family DNA-binding transcriptional regulator [Escherichia coli]|nr:LacI family DNA-binding transcriptional regulator [Escherichia coli]
MVTIREIAKRVGFSQATVSRVLKDDPTFSVKDSTREKILNASLEMGYKNVPQYQRITIPQDVAILDNVVPDEGLQDAYFDELREALVKHAEEQLMNVTMQKDVDSLIANTDKYAGFISIGPSPLDRKTLHRLHKKLPPRRLHRHQSCAGIVRFGATRFGTDDLGCD